MIRRDTSGNTMLGDRRLLSDSVPDIIKKTEFSNYNNFILTFYKNPPAPGHALCPLVHTCMTQHLSHVHCG